MGIDDQSYFVGSVSQFDGASGLLRTILNHILGTEVTGETLAGSGVNWAGSLANSPVGYGRLLVDYDISSVSYQAQDDGAGNIVGTSIATGTIDYDTGAYSITFDTAPDAAPTADYLYGEPGADWRQLVFRDTEDNAPVPTNPFGTDCKEVIIQNTGYSGQENVMVGMREWKYTAGDQHSWDLNGYISFVTAQGWNANSATHGRTSYDATLECWDQHPQIPLVDDTMYYWVFSNRQRIIIVVKVQSNYESIYLGFGRRFGLPSEYPYPLVIKGCAHDGDRFSVADNTRRFIPANQWATDGYGFWCVDPSNAYRIPYGTQYAIRGCRMEPYLSFDTTYGTMGKTPVNEYVFMQPCYIYDQENSRVLMDLEGVFLTASAGIQSEDILHAGGIKHRVFQNIHRTTYQDFMAVEQETGTTTTTTTTTSTTTTSSSTTSTTGSTTTTSTTTTTTTV